MSSKTDIVVTRQMNWRWEAQIVEKPLVAFGKTEAEAIGNLWLEHLGDMIALFLELADNENKRLHEEFDELTEGAEELEHRIESLEQVIASLCIESQMPWHITKKELDAGEKMIVNIEDDEEGGILIHLIGKEQADGKNDLPTY